MMTTVTVVVPAYNEGSEFGANLVLLADHLSLYGSTHHFNYIIVDDGSTDETRELALNFAKFRRNVLVVSHERNRGLGAALGTAFARAYGQYTVVVNADLSYHPSVAMELLEHLERDGGDIAIASPYIPGGSMRNVPALRRILSRGANRLLSLAANGRYATFTCMVRAYRTAFIKTLSLVNSGVENSAEIMLTAIRKQAAIIEVPAALRLPGEHRMPALPTITSIIHRTFATARLAFSFRPALWLAVPGLFPGLLPLVLAALALAHANAHEMALATVATLSLQYASLAIFAGQLGTFIARAMRNANQHRAAQRAMYS